jgi:hypothetical protein
VIALLAALLLGQAQSISNPTPGAAPLDAGLLQVNSVAADAGGFAVIVADAGFFGNLNILGTASLPGTSVSIAAGYSLYNASAQGLQIFILPGGSGKTVFSGVVTGSSGFADATHPLAISPNGATVTGPLIGLGFTAIDAGMTASWQVGTNSQAFDHDTYGTCSLSSGTCNAVVPGCQGNFYCGVDLQSSSQTNVGCNCVADAGSASAYCLATASGTAAVRCYH